MQFQCLKDLAHLSEPFPSFVLMDQVKTDPVPFFLTVGAQRIRVEGDIVGLLVAQCEDGFIMLSAKGIVDCLQYLIHVRVELLDDQVAFYGTRVGHKFGSIVLEVVLHKFFILLEYFVGRVVIEVGHVVKDLNGGCLGAEAETFETHPGFGPQELEIASGFITVSGSTGGNTHSIIR